VECSSSIVIHMTLHCPLDREYRRPTTPHQLPVPPGTVGPARPATALPYTTHHRGHYYTALDGGCRAGMSGQWPCLYDARQCTTSTLVACVCVCVCVFTCGGIHRNQHTSSGPYPPTFQVPKVNSLVTDTVCSIGATDRDSSSISLCS
jgi:hypothetical protein